MDREAHHLGGAGKNRGPCCGELAPCRGQQPAEDRSAVVPREAGADPEGKEGLKDDLPYGIPGGFFT